jgi:hypothetical protein
MKQNTHRAFTFLGEFFLFVLFLTVFSRKQDGFWGAQEVLDLLTC